MGHSPHRGMGTAAQPSLHRRVLVAACVLALLLTGTALAVGAALRRVEASQDLVRQRLQPGSEQVRSLLADVVDQETGQRGYVITGDPTFLEPYKLGQTASETRIASLRRTFAGDPGVLRAVDQVEADLAQWHRLGADPEIAAARAGDPARARALIAQGRGKAAFDALRSHLADLQARIDARHSDATRSVREANAVLARVITASAVLLVLLVLGAGLLLRRWVLHPIAALRASMRRVAEGHLDEPIEALGPPEVAAIGTDAESMRRRILDEVDAARAAGAALAQHSPVVAGLRAELAARSGGSLPGVTLAGALRPAEGVLAGDWWDAVRRPDGTVVVLLADVSGHGADAGLVAARFKHRLTALLHTRLELDEAFATAAEDLGGDDERFLSCLVIAVDPLTGTLRWINAGHPPAVIVQRHRTGLGARELGPTGPLLSSVSSGWQVERTTLEPTELLLAFTDGVSEARRGHEAGSAEFGTDGVLTALGGLGAWSPDVAVAEILEAVRQHADNWHRDDVTVVALTLDGRRATPAHPVAVTVTAQTDVAPAY
ncbi:MAG: PP2C family protein-serine/threonine phosphatase [Oryzihumus sp.]